jgi:hypothetical protein
MEIIRESIGLDRLRVVAQERFGDLIKAVVDVERGMMAVSAELHSDEEAALLDDGSRHDALWGINLYPAEHGAENVGRVRLNDQGPTVAGQPRSRSVEDPVARERIVTVLDALVRPRPGQSMPPSRPAAGTS